MLPLQPKLPRFLLPLPVFGRFGRCRGQGLSTVTNGVSICCSWRGWRLRISPTSLLGSQVATYKTGFGAVPASTIRLLVDADAHGIDVIRQGIRYLEKEGYNVHTVLFAPPGRDANQKWKRFIREHGIRFQPVPRAMTYSNQPSDDAIVSAMLKQPPCMDDVASLALLTSDAGFAGPAATVQARGTGVIIMLIPGGRIGVFKKYEAAGLKTVKLESNEAAPMVRAVLHKSGSGSVHLADAFEPLAQPQPHEVVEIFLEKFGFKTDEGNLIQKCVKHWFENCSGSITVYPPQLAVLAVHNIMHSAESESGKVNSGHLAYFLPVTAVGPPLSKQDRKIFGSRLARQVSGAGGPFMKQDSPTLVAEVLAKLGYTDEMNRDLREPMFCFINKTENKKLLRQTGLLPRSGEGDVEVMRKLRAAFLSNLSTGMWQINKMDDFSAMKPVVQILQKARLLAEKDSSRFSRDEVFAAMKVYDGLRTKGGPAFDAHL